MGCLAPIETCASKSTGKELYRVVWRDNSGKRSKTFQEFAKAESRHTDVEAATRFKYRSIYRNYLAWSFGELRIDTITEDDVAELVADMIEDERSSKTIRNAHGLLKSVTVAGLLSCGSSACGW